MRASHLKVRFLFSPCLSPHRTADNASSCRVLINPDVSFAERLYTRFDCELKTVRLAERLAQIVGGNKMYNRKLVSGDCFRCLTAVVEVRLAPTARERETKIEREIGREIERDTWGRRIMKLAQRHQWLTFLSHHHKQLCVCPEWGCSQGFKLDSRFKVATPVCPTLQLAFRLFFFLFCTFRPSLLSICISCCPAAAFS